MRIKKYPRTTRCPNCNSKNVYPRRRIKPKYKCVKCGNTFEDPKEKIFFVAIQEEKDYDSEYFEFDI